MAENIEEAEDFLLDDEDVSNENKYLLSRLGEEVYGINIADVTEIIEMQKITEVPDMPEYVKGVINLRGKVIPIIDLRLKFGMEEREHDNRTCIIIVTAEARTLGFIVDTVTEVIDIPEKEIAPPPKFKDTSEKEQFISGLGKVGDQVRILLDVQRIVGSEEKETLAKLKE